MHVEITHKKQSMCDEIKLYLREIEIMKKISSPKETPYLVNLVDVYDTPEKIYVVKEMCVIYFIFPPLPPLLSLPLLPPLLSHTFLLE
jgi:serine/threonine protein kinase